jgi:hypothetical protein
VSGLDLTAVLAGAKLADGFALADRMLAAARSGDHAALGEAIEEVCDHDVSLAAAVIARLLGAVLGRDAAEEDAAARAAGIVPHLETVERRSAGGLVLP